MNRITTLVVGPLVEQKVKELAGLFLKEVLKSGGKLVWHPRKVLKYYDLHPWKKIWEMKIGENEKGEIVLSGGPIYLTVVEAERPDAVVDRQGVLLVQFVDMRKSISIESDSNGNPVLNISLHVKPSHMRGIVHQLIADHVVNGRTEEYIMAGRRAVENEKRRKADEDEKRRRAERRAERTERKREEARHRLYPQ